MKHYYTTGKVLKLKRKRQSTAGGQRKKPVSVEQKTRFCQMLYGLSEQQLGAMILKLEKICPRSIEKSWENEDQDYGEEEAKIHLDEIEYDDFQKLHTFLTKASKQNDEK